MWTSVINTNHSATYPVHTNFKETTNGSVWEVRKKTCFLFLCIQKIKLFFSSHQIKKLSLLLEKINKMFRYIFLNLSDHSVLITELNVQPQHITPHQSAATPSPLLHFDWSPEAQERLTAKLQNHTSNFKFSKPASPHPTQTLTPSSQIFPYYSSKRQNSKIQEKGPTP